MKKQSNSKISQKISYVERFARQYWIGLAFAVLCVLAMMTTPAEAAPSPQRTVPTATPTSAAPDPTATDVSSDNDDDDDVRELFDPTPTSTPEAPELNFDDDEFLSGGGSLDESFDEITEDDIDSLFDEDGEFSATVDTTFVNMFAEPDRNSGIIDTLFRDTPVQILAQDTLGEWVYLCCGEDRGNQGWVPTSDINFDFDLNDTETALPTLGADTAATDEELSAEPLLDGDAPVALEAEMAELELAMSLNSTNVFPGQAIELEFAITNIGGINATDISLRNELPDILIFEDADSIDGNLTTTTNLLNNDAPVFRIDWDELAVGDTVTATVKIQVSEDADYGIVVDNLAGVGAANAEIETAGVTLGTPPLLPPDFRFLR